MILEKALISIRGGNYNFSGKQEVGKAEENQGPLHSRLTGNINRGAMGDSRHSRLLHL